MKPLAERMRPSSLEDYVGQQHLVGPEGVLRKAIESGKVPSFILWGPPGVGKTTLAQIIATQLKRPFQLLSAIHSGVKDIREAIQLAEKQRFFDNPNPIVFIDEIHRFSKSQQDALLGAVEKGIFTLIGATTENPSFEVIPALLSRCQVYVLEPLTVNEMSRVLNKALQTDEELKKSTIEIHETEALFRFAGGDARKLLNILEILMAQVEDGLALVITNELVTKVLQENLTRYDKGGEQHYDIASAFIKSIRGSDPNAAVYWLARMIEGGEDPVFICRRMIISAAEDIGLANPNALLMATTTLEAVRTVGFPESRIILSQAAIYLATSPKSNAAYLAINEAQSLVKQTASLPVPLHLRNAPTKLMEELGYGKSYQYAHDFDNNFVQQDYLPSEIEGTILFNPQENPSEVKIRQNLIRWWKGKYRY